MQSNYHRSSARSKINHNFKFVTRQKSLSQNYSFNQKTVFTSKFDKYTIKDSKFYLAHQTHLASIYTTEGTNLEKKKKMTITENAEECKQEKRERKHYLVTTPFNPISSECLPKNIVSAHSRQCHYTPSLQ